MSGRVKVKVRGDDYIDDWNAYLKKSKKYFHSKWSSDNKAKMSKEDFEFLGSIASGGSGDVELAQKKNAFFAIKILKNCESIKKKKHQNLINERRALLATKFPFIIHMDFYFVDNKNTYFVMPYIPGGDLWSHLRRSGKLSESDTRFYASQILLAIEYLHFLGLIYRDLKPENILIDIDGYIKLADLGFCKPINGRTYTMCGSIEFIAPEVVLNQGYGFAADWWSFGVLLYELCAGFTPFLADSEAKVFEKITNCDYTMEKNFSNILKDLIRNLLQKNPTFRYGNLKSGVDGIKRHLWFDEVNWLQVLNKKDSPPFVPNITGPGDLSYFQMSRASEEPLPIIRQASVFDVSFSE